MKDQYSARHSVWIISRGYFLLFVWILSLNNRIVLIWLTLRAELILSGLKTACIAGVWSLFASSRLAFFYASMMAVRTFALLSRCLIISYDVNAV